MAETAEYNLTYDDDGWCMCPVQGCKFASPGLRFRGWSNGASAQRHFNRHHEGKLHVGLARLPRVTKEQRREQMRRASQAYRDRGTDEEKEGRCRERGREALP